MAEVISDDKGGILLNIFHEIIGSPLNLVLVGVITILVYTIFKRRQQHYLEPVKEPELPKLKKDFTNEELKKYDGTGPDGRILIAVDGKVFDVTRGKNFYGPGGAYSAFAGRDASRGLATFNVSVSKEGYDDLSDLDGRQMEEVREWAIQFHEKYIYVGKLLKPGEAPTNYSDEEEEKESSSEKVGQESAANQAGDNKPAEKTSNSADFIKQEQSSDKPKAEKGGRMDHLRKRTTDYTDFAYKEAVSKLRYLLAESYNPASGLPKYTISHHHRHHHTVFADDGGTDHNTAMSLPVPISHVSPPKRPYPVPTNSQQAPAELISFIEKQEEYIEQLEKESQYCRDELSNLMGKVKEVISENEGLHERRKSGMLKTAFDSFEMEDYDDYDDDTNDEKEYRVTEPNGKRPLMGPNIVFESRISELEAQLTQAKMDLRKAQEEAESLRKQLAESRVYPAIENISEVDSDRQIQMLQREKEELMEIVEKLQATVAQIRDKEANATQKVRRSLDVVDQAQFEKNQAELEVRRLKTEVDRLNEKLRETAAEQTRRLTEVERRYATQAEQLSGDLATQWDNNTRLNLELDRQRRLETDLRRDLLHKSATIDDLKKELNSRISSLQSEVVQAGAEREGLEAEAVEARLAAERAERSARHDSARMQAELQALRQRLDRADADLLHSRKENLRLNEHVSSLERELHMAKLANEEVGSMKDSKREKELTAMIMDMDSKHVKNVAELEGMIQSQTQLMEKLKDECQMLTRKLEDCATRHKKDKSTMKEQNEKLVDRLSRVWENCKDLRTVCAQYGIDVDGQETIRSCGGGTLSLVFACHNFLSHFREDMAGLQNNIDYLNNKVEASSYDNQQWRDDGMAGGYEQSQYDESAMSAEPPAD